MGSGLLFAVMAVVAIVSLQATVGEREMNTVFYFHNNLSGRDPVAGLNGSSSNVAKFGTLVVFSEVITKGPNSASDQIVGQGQGMYVNTNLVTGLDFFTVFTLIFQNSEYKGSTLEFQGTDRFGQPECEFAVVGGTGKFRFARGYAVVTTQSVSGFNAVVKFNTTFLLPK